MQFNRASYLNTRRDAWVEINLDSIEKNILEFKKYLPKRNRSSNILRKTS